MILPDVNVLIYAFRRDSVEHDRFRDWWRAVLASESAFGISELVLSAVVRIVTHPKVYKNPSPLPVVLEFCEQIRSRPNCVPVCPGDRHWAIFGSLCSATGATGNEVPDAYLAALAIESGCQWITEDKGFARFPGLRWASVPREKVP